MKNKNKLKRKYKKQNSLDGNIRPAEDAAMDVVPQKENMKKELPDISNNGVNDIGGYGERNAINNENEISITRREHIMYIGIGVIFSIILYLVSFLV